MTHAPKGNTVAGMPTPPDGGWGWVIVMASFLIHIITDGITYSFGVMYVELLKEFNEGKGYTSWILSLMCGMTLCSGPISSTFVNNYGCRAVTIAGAVIASACLLVSYYAQNVLTLIITIGFGAGCGLGLIYLPAIVSVSTHFERYRSIAIGIAVAGSGFGTFIFAPLVSFFIKTYGWRFTMIVLSGIVLNCALFGSLFRPLQASAQQVAVEEEQDTRNQNGTAKKDKRSRSTIRVPSFTAIAEVGETQMTRSQSVGTNMVAKKASSRSQYNNKTDGTRCMLSQPLLFEAVPENRPLGDVHRRASGTLSRPDIFYQGSLHNIPNYRSQSELNADLEKLGSLAQVNEDEENPSQEACCVGMMNFGLFANPIFVVFLFSNFSTCLGFYVPYFCLADKAKMLGMSTEEASYLLATIGIANTIGRIVLGFISDRSWVNRLWIYNVCLFICGIATASSVLCLTFETLVVYSAVFGFTIGAYVGLTSVILVDLLGLDKLTNAFGLLLLFQGIASFIGPPIVGLLYDQTQSYGPGFLFAGAMIANSGFILFFIPLLQNRQKRLEEKKDAKAQPH